MSVEIRVEGGTNAARRRLNGVQRRVDYPDAAWKKVGAYLSREVRKQFMTRGANFGTPWRPLAPSTRAEKRRLGYPPAPLVRTGVMRRTFVGRPMQIEVYAGQVAFFGSASQVARWQHGGTFRNGRRHIPPRPILKVTPRVRKDIVRILDRHIKKGN